MRGRAVARIEDQNFEVFSVLPINDTESKTLIIHEDNIETLFEPIHDQYKPSIIEKARQEMRDIAADMFDKEDQITLIDLKSMSEYKIGIHKFANMIFAFLVRPLNDEELSKIEKESTGKTYFTGDPADLSLTREDFKH